jgi:hypothetical protein
MSGIRATVHRHLPTLAFLVTAVVFGAASFAVATTNLTNGNDHYIGSSISDDIDALRGGIVYSRTQNCDVTDVCRP